jgi:hypothetical protein
MRTLLFVAGVAAWCYSCLALAGSAAVESTARTGAEQAAPVDIASRRQFWFNAQDLIADARDVRVVQCRPAKHPMNPLMVADRPWEGTLVQLYSADVRRDPASGRWQMWYEGHPAEVLLCSAFSRDGLRWEKPNLGLQQWQGDRENNIVLQTGYWDANCCSLVVAPTEKDPARRYKLYYWVGPEWFNAKNPLHVKAGNRVKEYKKNGHYVAFSPDGIRFTPQTAEPAFVASDVATVLFDEQSGRYRSYHKAMRTLPGWKTTRRCMSSAASDDGVHFGPSAPTLAPDEEDDALVVAAGGVRAEFYGMHVWPHEGFYLGLAWVFTVTRGNPRLGRGGDDGWVLPQLIYSPDGLRWKRLPVREPFIERGPAGSFDAGSICTSGDHPATIGDEVRFYYTGVCYTHGAGYPKNSPQRYSGVGLATLSRDRYVGWHAGAGGGTIATEPLRFSGRRLHLNLDASRGETRVAILDGDGKPLPGFGLADCRPAIADSLDCVVEWSAGGDLADLAGKPVRLQFRLRNSVLYTWQFR